MFSSKLNKNDLINCILELQYLNQKAIELITNGIVVIDLHFNEDYHNFIHKTNWIEEIKNIQLRDFNTKDPNYGFVLGAFGAC